MSFDSLKPASRADPEPFGGSLERLPPWELPASSSKVPPYVKHPRRHVAPQMETVFKLLGVLLILTAMIAAGLVAMPDRDRAVTSTVVPDPALVIAESNDTLDQPSGAASPLGENGFVSVDPRYQDIIICLDAGHGGEDRGHQRAATVSAAAMDESYFNLAIANALRDRLEQRGFIVVMTRTDDFEVNVNDLDANRDGNTQASAVSAEESRAYGALDEVQSRIDRCNDARASTLVSIHVDGSPDPDGRGSSIWYSSARPFAPLNQLLATMLYEELGLQLPVAGYDGKGQGVFDETGLRSHGDEHIQSQFLIVGDAQEGLKEPSAMPGIVAEVLMITNDDDALFLTSETGFEAAVSSLDQAIVRFVDMTQLERAR